MTELSGASRTVNFSLETDQTGTASISWPTIADPLLDDFDVFLVDVDAGTSVDMRLQTSYSLDVTPGTRPLQLQLTVGRVKNVDAGFSMSPPIGVVSEPVQFTDESTDPEGGSVVAWDYDFGDSQGSSNPSPSHIYLGPGEVTVTLTVTDDEGNTDSTSSPLTVLSRPISGFSFLPIVPVTGEPVAFTSEATDADGSIVSWGWESSDGNSGSGPNPSITFFSSGPINVTLTVTDDDGLIQVSSQDVIVTDRPAAAFSVSAPHLVPGPNIQFNDESTDADGTIVSWDWDFDDGGSSDLQNPSHSFASADTFNVTLTVTDDIGATDSISLEVVIEQGEPPEVAFSFTPDPFIVNGTARFTDESTDPDNGIVSRFWEFGDGGTSTHPTPSHVYRNAGFVDVTLTVVDEAGNSASLTIAGIPVHALPTADFSFSPATPVTGEEVQFTDLSNDSDGSVIAWDWTFGDGFTSTEQDPVHVYSTNTTFSVRLTVTDDDGHTRFRNRNVPVRVGQRPTAAFSVSPESPTVAGPAQFTDESTDEDAVVAWAWDFGDGGTSTEQNPSHTFIAAGTFAVSLTARDTANLVDTITRDIVVGLGEPPVAEFSFLPGPPVAGEQVLFTDESTDADDSIVQWAWDFGDTKSSDLQHPTHTYNDPGSVDVTLTVTDQAGNSSSLTISGIPVLSRPTADFGFGPSPGLEGEAIQFTDLSTDEGPIVAWSWTFGDTGSSTDQDPAHTYAAAGTFDVELTVTDSDGLQKSLTRQVEVV